LTSIVVQYDKEKKESKKNGKNMKKGALNTIIMESKKEFELKMLMFR